MSFVLIRDRSRLGHKPDCRLGWSSEYVRKSMYACHSVSVACRPAETRRGEIGSIRRSILVWSPATQPVLKGYTATLKMHCITLRDQQPFKNCWNDQQSPFMSFVLVRDRSWLGHKPDCRLGWSSEYVRKSMYACHSVSVACRPAETRAAKSSQFVGQFSWVTGDPTGLKERGYGASFHSTKKKYGNFDSL